MRIPVIVMGGGHAGCEAAAAAARMGIETLLVTMQPETLGKMSCNPAIGGVGKGHLVREIDALGGLMGRLADRAAIQYKVLNRRKGPAVWGLRAQEDRRRYAEAAREEMLGVQGLEIWRGTVVEIIVEGGRAVGAVGDPFGEIQADVIVLASGTFLGGKIHRGEEITTGGRIGEEAVGGLTAKLVAAGLRSGRFKTGTPPRIDGDTADDTRMKEEWGDENPIPFSSFGIPSALPRRPCWLTGTTEATHEIIRRNIGRAPLYTGQIEAVGPRSCPSVEDKVMRFPDRPSHRIFVEPEGLDTRERYLNGLSTSLPAEVQDEIVSSIPGLEGARITQYGYAIEYDYFPPEQLRSTLETKKIRGLFLAGQINGTTGYEEAGALGLWAGINAARSVQEQEPPIVDRTRAYLGVMIDDLVTRGVEHPYRMYTSRAEFRLSLRNDNADLRLFSIGRELGLLSPEQCERIRAKRDEIGLLEKAVRNTSWSRERLEGAFGRQGERFRRNETLAAVLRRPGIHLSDILESGLGDAIGSFRDESIREVELSLKYEGYIRRGETELLRMRRLEEAIIPEEIDYPRIQNLSAYSRDRLSEVRPRTLGQASRIPGITSNDVSVLAIILHKHRESGIEDRPAIQR
jgi:tRNA uridine 5-carboxymethylaminomethyl modification enzyme